MKTNNGERKKLHITAYFIKDEVDRLRTVDDTLQLSELYIPDDMFISARSSKDGEAWAAGDQPKIADPSGTSPLSATSTCEYLL
ncbi:hypothetical protein EYR40_000431 [Pleurotus pulmonarius]|nr:hypothetical protein EYR40_000431 [Pleurotus pulmonarius]